MKQKKTGTYKQKVNDLGNSGTHKKHKVVLEQSEDSKFVRGRVSDQLYIDRLLLADQIDLVEHKAAEYVLKVFVSAGVYVRTPDMSALSVSGGRKDKYTHGLLKMKDLCEYLAAEVGEDEALMICQSIVKDTPLNPEELLIFRHGMQHIDKRYISKQF
jgi:hypothetical protein